MTRAGSRALLLASASASMGAVTLFLTPRSRHSYRRFAIPPIAARQYGCSRYRNLVRGSGGLVASARAQSG